MAGVGRRYYIGSIYIQVRKDTEGRKCLNEQTREKVQGRHSGSRQKEMKVGRCKGGRQACSR